jgi:hypothetical protein
MPGGIEENTENAVRTVGIAAEIGTSLFRNKVKSLPVVNAYEKTGTNKKIINKRKNNITPSLMREQRNAYRILVGKLEGKGPLGRPDVGGWTILKWILERYDVAWTGSIWLSIRTSGGACEHGNEPSGSIKCWKVLE